MPGLLDYAPNAEDLVALSAEDLGMILLELIQQRRSLRFTPSDFEMPLWNANAPGYLRANRLEVNRTIAEAWQWLQNEGLIMIDLDHPNGWFCLTRKGDALASTADLEAYRHGNILPESLLHTKLVAKVRPMFLRGDYDVAVVQAFKIVEVAVRTAAGLPDDVTGVKLMRAAFNPETGALRDRLAPAAERQAMSDLFAGAFGHARNPPSHRDVSIHRLDAAKLIGLASYLLSLAELMAVLS